MSLKYSSFIGKKKKRIIKYFMWEKEYKKKTFYWGLKPDPLLVKYLPQIPKGKALDIGAGEGRNSFFLAKEGFEVEAIDIVKEGLKNVLN